MGFTSILKRIKAFNKYLVLFSSIFMCLMILIIIHGVFMRYLLHAPKAYSVELSSFAMMPVIAFALSYAQQLKAHVRVDILVNYLPDKVQKILNVFTLAIFLLYAAGLTCASWDLTLLHFSKNIHSTDARFPLWLISISFFIGTTSLCLQILIDIFENIEAFIHSTKSKEV